MDVFAFGTSSTSFSLASFFRLIAGSRHLSWRIQRSTRPTHKLVKPMAQYYPMHGIHLGTVAARARSCLLIYSVASLMTTGLSGFETSRSRCCRNPPHRPCDAVPHWPCPITRYSTSPVFGVSWRQVAKELFNAAFVSCWETLHIDILNKIVASIENVGLLHNKFPRFPLVSVSDTLGTCIFYYYCWYSSCLVKFSRVHGEKRKSTNSFLVNS